jgi:putative hydrolase of the HAD superfamily
MRHTIKNIVFDFGGILLDLDYSLSFDRLKELLSIDGDIPAHVQLILDEYEMGYFGEGAFLHRLQRLTDDIVTERALVDAWNAMLLSISTHKLDFVKSLHSDYNVYLLSNTNHTHLTYVRQKMLPVINIDPASFEKDHFIKAYYSHEIKYRKPNHDIYEYVLADSQLIPSETIFIDDNADNVRGAQEVGLHAVVHDPALDITKKLSDYLKEF